MPELALPLIAKEKEARTGRLDLGRCGLTKLPEALFELEWLEELSVCNRYWDHEQREYVNTKNIGAYNLLRGNLPEQLKKLTQLKTLRLGGSGTISNSINTIFSDYWELEDISVLQNLQNLQSLDLRYNRQIKDFSVLQNLQNLQSLDLRYNGISDISVLQNLHNLQTLDLRSTDISDISV
ncbi:MAG: leucine-rich repeat domain-containing protein, partial [Bacteroidota bacterium]